MSEQRFARRRLAGRWQRWRWLAGCILVLAVVVVLVWLVWFSTVLGVRHVKVLGADTIKSQQISVRAAIAQGEPLARIDTAAAEARVAALERVESVSVRRSWPNTVTIDITERQSVAWIRFDGKIRGLDRFGVDFRDYHEAPKDLFEVRVPADISSRRQAALVEAAKVVVDIRNGDKKLYDKIKHMSVSSKDSVEFTLPGDRLVRWGSAAHGAQKLAVLTPLLRISARSYDVSAPEQPTTRQ